MIVKAEQPIRIGIDIGGTFTDLQIWDGRTGIMASHKVPTTPDDPSIGLMAGIKAAALRFGFALSDVSHVLHGTTIATNAVLERKFPPAALITTAGFEDVLEIARHNRRDIYSVWPQPAPVLIPRNLRFGIAERTTAHGKIAIPLTDESLAALVRRVAAAQVETVAVSLLNSYLNTHNESRIAEWLSRELPDLPVSLSSTISPEIREYERTSTTALNALLVPVVRSYMDRLVARFHSEGFSPVLLIVQSNGGVCSPATAALEPVRLLLSGPSGGAMAARAISQRLQLHNLVGVDMGGTSFDVSVIRDGRIEIVTQGEIDRLPVRVPMVEIRTIGAGGGSIAQLEDGVRLQVGPRSAGAQPGPVCYGRGGTEPTVTDANLVLGRLDPAYFLGGAMKLDLACAREAIATRIAAPLGVAVEAAAEGVLKITNASLAAAIRLSLFEKGLDPRSFAIASFGGAGSVHACAVAEELGIRRIVFPPDASTLSAWGILQSDIEHDLVASRIMLLNAAALPVIADMAGTLRAGAIRLLSSDGIPAARHELTYAADLRYTGQAFELTVRWPHEPSMDCNFTEVLRSYHALHQQQFSYSNPGDDVELVALRLKAVGRLTREHTAGASAPLPIGTLQPSQRRVWLDGRWLDVKVWRRNSLVSGESYAGPIVIEEEYTTVLVANGWRVTVDASGNLLADLGAAP